jgi:hypothetical protein
LGRLPIRSATAPQGTNEFIQYTTGKKVSSRWHESRPADLRDNRQRAPQKPAPSTRKSPRRRSVQTPRLDRTFASALRCRLAAYDLVSGIRGGESAPPRGRLTAGLDLEADWITCFRQTGATRFGRNGREGASSAGRAQQRRWPDCADPGHCQIRSSHNKMPVPAGTSSPWV